MKQAPSVRTSEKQIPNQRRSQSQGKYLQPINRQQGTLCGSINLQKKQRQKTQTNSNDNNQMNNNSQQNPQYHHKPLHSPDTSSPKEHNLDSQSSSNSRKTQNKKALLNKKSQSSCSESAFETPKFSFGNPTALGSQLASNNNSPTCDTSFLSDNKNCADNAFYDGHFSFGKNIDSYDNVSIDTNSNTCLFDMNRQPQQLNKILGSKENSIQNNSFTQISSFVDDKTKEIVYPPNKNPILKSKTTKCHNNPLKNIKQQQQQSIQVPSKPTYNFYNFLDKENIFQLPFSQQQSQQHKQIPKKLPNSFESSSKQIPIHFHGNQGFTSEIQRLKINNNPIKDCRNSYCTEVNNNRWRSAQRRSFDGLFESENILISNSKVSSLNQTFDSSESSRIISKGGNIKRLRTPDARQIQNVLSHKSRITTLL